MKKLELNQLEIIEGGIKLISCEDKDLVGAIWGATAAGAVFGLGIGALFAGIAVGATTGIYCSNFNK